MASRKKTATTPKNMRATRKPLGAVAESQFTVVLEDIRSQFQAFGEALQGLRESDERQSAEVRSELGLVKDAIRTHTSELKFHGIGLHNMSSSVKDVRGITERIDAKLDNHERRLKALEGDAAE